MRGANEGVTPLVDLLICFNTSSSSLSKLSLRLCLLPVLNSLLTEMMGVLALGGLELVDAMVNDDDEDDDDGIDDDVVVLSISLLLRSVMEGFLSCSCATSPLLVVLGAAPLPVLKSMAVTSSLSDDCSHFTDELLFNNGFFNVSRFKFLVGGGRIAGFG